MIGLKESPVFPPLTPDMRTTILARLAAMLSNRQDVAYAWAHGSSVAGLAFRDIDVAVARRGEAGDGRPSASLDWTFHLADKLSRAVGLPVDVQPLDGAPIAFRAGAFRGVLLCAPDRDRLDGDLERTAVARCEFEVHRRRMTREALGVE